MTPVRLDRVGKSYGSAAPVVHDIDVTIESGEFFTLLGPSGCGKSTTLRMIAGFVTPTTGRILFGDRDITDTPPNKRGTGMVFQNYALFPHYDVAQNVAYGLVTRKVPKAERAERVAAALAAVGLEGYADRRIDQLSGGQQQRVALARALVISPSVLLLDEPLSNLDAKLRVQMRTSVSKLQKRLGTTTVYVTHDQTEAMTLGDRVVVLRGGVVQQVGPPQHLYEHPANLFVAGFIGSPAMNFVPVEVEDGVLRTPLGDVPLRDRVRRELESADAPRELVLGIRPEHFEDAALLDDATRSAGTTFRGEVDVVEEMGSDKYVYFTLQGGRASTSELEELAADSGSTEVPTAEGQVVTRLAVESQARENAQLEVWFDPDKIHLFDPSTGRSLI